MKFKYETMLWFNTLHVVATVANTSPLADVTRLPTSDFNVYLTFKVGLALKSDRVGGSWWLPWHALPREYDIQYQALHVAYCIRIAVKPV